jgi:hypothetical protein
MCMVHLGQARVLVFAIGAMVCASSFAEAGLQVPAGELITVRTLEDLDVRRTEAGYHFSMALVEPLIVQGNVVAPHGARAYGQVTEVGRSARVAGRAHLAVSLVQIQVGQQMVPVETTVLKVEGPQQAYGTAVKAGAGAAIGAIFGGGRGAAVGAAAGTGAAIVTQGDHVRIPANSFLTFSLRVPMNVDGTPSAAQPSSGGPGPSPLALQVAARQASNHEALLHYRWEQRTQLAHGIDTIYDRKEQLRFLKDGTIKRSLILEDDEKTGDYIGYIQHLPKLRPYALPSPDALTRFITGAKVANDPDTQMIIASRENVVEPGDTIGVWIDPKTRDLKKILVKTVYRGKPVRATIDFDKLLNGPVYPSKATVNVPGDEVRIIVETFRFERDE